MFGKIRSRYRLAAAVERMTVAEGELTVAMAELVVTERAEKQIVGERLRKAMAELIVARNGLSRLMR